MPLPDPTDGCHSEYRIALQAAVFCCYLLVAIALLFSAWRMSATSAMTDHVLDQQTEIMLQQTEILKEIKEVRTTVPAEVKQEVKAVVKEVVK